MAPDVQQPRQGKPRNEVIGCLQSLACLFAGAAAVLFFLPRILGWAYAVAAVPLYEVTTGNSVSDILHSPIDSDKYYQFISGQSDSTHKLHNSSSPDDQNPYNGMGDFWGNDFISQMFKKVWEYEKHSFVEATRKAAGILIPFINDNALFRAFYYLAYLAAATILTAYLASLGQHLFKKHFSDGK